MQVSTLVVKACQLNRPDKLMQMNRDAMKKGALKGIILNM